MFTKVSKKNLNNGIIIKNIEVYFQLLASGALGLLGVYVENECKTIFPIANEKKGKEFKICAFVRSRCVPLTLRLFIQRIDFFTQFNHLGPLMTISNHQHHWGPLGAIGNHQVP